MEKKMLDRVFTYLEENEGEMVRTLESLVAMNSYSKDKEDIVDLMEHLKSLFEEEGFKCDLVDVGPNGPSLVGVYNSHLKEKPVLFSGHLDTVFKKGAYGRTFEIQGDKMFGPGVLDMKGGIVIGLYVIKALIACGFDERPIKIAFSGDEEIGHLGGRGGQVLKEAGEGCICAFNLETGLLDNSLCIGRKGRILAKVFVKGVQSHAGNDFLSGRNAIEEMAHKVLEIRGLTKLDKGTTVTSSIISGGTISNAIPGECYLEVECRFETLEELEGYKKSLERICSKNYIDGTSTRVEFSDAFPAFETTSKVMDFYDFINRVAKENNLDEVKSIRLGGGSDAAYIQMSDIPVICSIGIQGEGNHTKEEYALISSMVKRGKLISASILNLSNFK